MGLGELLAGRLTPAARPVKTYELPVEVEVIRMDGKVVKLFYRNIKYGEFGIASGSSGVG